MMRVISEVRYTLIDARRNFRGSQRSSTRPRSDHNGIIVRRRLARFKIHVRDLSAGGDGGGGGGTPLRACVRVYRDSTFGFFAPIHFANLSRSLVASNIHLGHIF